jgi:hypothetical protein
MLFIIKMLGNTEQNYKLVGRGRTHEKLVQEMNKQFRTRLANDNKSDQLVTLSLHCQARPKSSLHYDTTNYSNMCGKISRRKKKPAWFWSERLAKEALKEQQQYIKLSWFV